MSPSKEMLNQSPNSKPDVIATTCVAAAARNSRAAWALQREREAMMLTLTRLRIDLIDPSSRTWTKKLLVALVLLYKNTS